MIQHEDLLENKQSDSDKIAAAIGAQINITGTGNGRVTFGDGNIEVKRIMHVPDLTVKLSVS